MALTDFIFGKKEEPKSEPKQIQPDLVENFHLRNIELPMPKEHKGTDWVLWGQNNSFPLDLLEYKNGSATHNAIIEGKTSLISGLGFMFGKTREESDQFLVENWKLVPFWRKLDGTFKNVTRDFQTFGYACFEVIYSMDRTRVVDINWIDACKIAPEKKENEFEEVDSYYYCEDWSNTRKYPPREIEAFNPNEDGARQLVFIKSSENNMQYFSLPAYYSALKWIKADMLMAEYGLAAINNGFSPSMVFKFYKKPTPDERRQNAEAIKAQHGGPKNAGKAIILYADGKDLAPDVTTIDATNIDQRLLQVSEQITQQIITAHRCHPALVGIQTPGKLGYSSELAQAWEIFDKMVIKPERKVLLDAFKSVLIYNGVARVEIEDLTPIKIEEAQPQGMSLSDCDCQKFADGEPCWEGYEMIGMKIVDGKEVPNCVPKKD